MSKELDLYKGILKVIESNLTVINPASVSRDVALTNIDAFKKILSHRKANELCDVDGFDTTIALAETMDFVSNQLDY